MRHIAEHVDCQHRVVLNCNHAMHVALESSAAVAPLRHPLPLEKQTFHGSLLQGIVRNIDFALRRYDFDSLLILSSRSWFRRPITLEEVALARAQLPFGADEVIYRFGEAHGYGHYEDELTPSSQHPGVADASGGDGDDASDVMVDNTLAAQGLFDWQVIKRTRLAAQIIKGNGHPLVSGPHEGLLLSHAACAHAVRALDGDEGRELFV